MGNAAGPDLSPTFRKQALGIIDLPMLSFLWLITFAGLSAFLINVTTITI